MLPRTQTRTGGAQRRAQQRSRRDFTPSVCAQPRFISITQIPKYRAMQQYAAPSFVRSRVLAPAAMRDLAFARRYDAPRAAALLHGYAIADACARAMRDMLICELPSAAAAARAARDAARAHTSPADAQRRQPPFAAVRLRPRRMRGARNPTMPARAFSYRRVSLMRRFQPARDACR